MVVSLSIFVLALLLIWRLDLGTQGKDASINLISTEIVQTTQSGDVDLIGKIVKNSGGGESGSYLLTSSTGSVVPLDVDSGLDALIGMKVRIIGTISASSAENLSPTLKLKSIEVVK